MIMGQPWRISGLARPLMESQTPGCASSLGRVVIGCAGASGASSVAAGAVVAGATFAVPESRGAFASRGASESLRFLQPPITSIAMRAIAWTFIGLAFDV